MAPVWLFCDTDLVLQKAFSQLGQVLRAVASRCHLLWIHHHILVCKREFVQKHTTVAKKMHTPIYLFTLYFLLISCRFLHFSSNTAHSWKRRIKCHTGALITEVSHNKLIYHPLFYLILTYILNITYIFFNKICKHTKLDLNQCSLQLILNVTQSSLEMPVRGFMWNKSYSSLHIQFAAQIETATVAFSQDP